MRGGFIDLKAWSTMFACRRDVVGTALFYSAGQPKELDARSISTIFGNNLTLFQQFFNQCVRIDLTDSYSLYNHFISD